MDPLMSTKDTAIFLSYLNKASVYLEFGCGGSTYQAILKPNIKRVYSVESDGLWIKKLKKIPLIQQNRNKVSFLFVDMKTAPNNLGYPGSKATQNERAKYSRTIKNLDPKIAERIDTVLIDGRFRVACALQCFNVINSDTVVLFDDFVKREDYHIVLNYYTIIEMGDNLVVLKKRCVDPPTLEILSKYELVAF